MQNKCFMMISTIDYSARVTIAGVNYGLRSELTELIIPEGVTELEKHCCFMCVNLKSAVLPSTLKTIGHGSFWKSGLTSITIPNSVTTIEAIAFADCMDLVSFNIPDGVTAIGPDTFSDSISLTSVFIPNSVTCINIVHSQIAHYRVLAFLAQSRQSTRMPSRIAHYRVLSSQLMLLSTMKRHSKDVHSSKQKLNHSI